MSNLRPLARQAIAHWKEHLPKMHASLQQAGTLESTALLAAETTLQDQATLVEQGFPPEAAWEMVRERYVFLPEEKGNSPEPEMDEGYATAVGINRGLGNLGMPEDEQE